MNTGSVLFTRTLRPRSGNETLVVESTYKAPKGEAFVLLLLGVAKGGEPVDPVQMLTNLGWTPPADIVAGKTIKVPA